jgi:hypothetical protein
MAQIVAGKHWPFNNRSGAVTMVTPLVFNSNMILPSLHSVPKHLTPATTLISVKKAAMCRAHKRCLISYVGSELVTGRNLQHSEMGCRFELLKSVAGFPRFFLVPEEFGRPLYFLYCVQQALSVPDFTTKQYSKAQ